MPGREKWFKRMKKRALNKGGMSVEEAAVSEAFTKVLGRDNVVFSPVHGNGKTTDFLVRSSKGKNALIKAKYEISEDDARRILDNYGRCYEREEVPARLVLMPFTPVSEKTRKVVDDYNRSRGAKVKELERKLESTNEKLAAEQRNTLSERERDELIEKFKELQFRVNDRKGVKDREAVKEELSEVQDKLLSDNNSKGRVNELRGRVKELEKSIASSQFHKAHIAPSSQLGNLLAYKIRSSDESAEDGRLLNIAKSHLKGSFSGTGAVGCVEEPRYPPERVVKKALDFFKGGSRSYFEYEPLTTDGRTPDFVRIEDVEGSDKGSSVIFEVKERLSWRDYQRSKSQYLDSQLKSGSKPDMLAVVSLSNVSGRLIGKNLKDLRDNLKKSKTPVVILTSKMLEERVRSRINHLEGRMMKGDISKENFEAMRSKGEGIIEELRNERERLKR